MNRQLSRRFGPYLESVRAMWDNKDQLPYAWRILKDGVCDGCALGTSGMKDWTMTGPHLCWIPSLRARGNPTRPPGILKIPHGLVERILFGGGRMNGKSEKLRC
ncbi:hypothetical protein DYH09_21190 [bacterium CPR1]|nr:hypothetical protein [bacterium CPR1]